MRVSIVRLLSVKTTEVVVKCNILVTICFSDYRSYLKSLPFLPCLNRTADINCCSPPAGFVRSIPHGLNRCGFGERTFAVEHEAAIDAEVDCIVVSSLDHNGLLKHCCWAPVVRLCSDYRL